jgi:hypothetical protein
MNPFDVWIVSFLNSFACRSWAFDTFMSEVLEKNGFIKGECSPPYLGGSGSRRMKKRMNGGNSFSMEWLLVFWLS